MQNVDRLSCVTQESGEKSLKEWVDGLTLIMITRHFILRSWSLCGGFSNNCLTRSWSIGGMQWFLMLLGVHHQSVTFKPDEVMGVLQNRLLLRSSVQCMEREV